MVDLSPVLQVAAVGALVAAVPLVWLAARRRGRGLAGQLRALTFLTLFLTFDLVLFGAYTRLSDSGLGCPDWPGCYGHASPLGAAADIAIEQARRPDGPVTHGKAWVEMVHRYFASAVGVLITVLMGLSWWLARRAGGAGRAASEVGHGQAHDAAVSPWWATLTFVWVCLQGAFGALTVTMKLYPAIVTAHLLGGIGLLALLTWQAERYRAQALVVDAATRRAVQAVLALVVLQIALGGWVSTNYAVLACPDLPTCQGQWWPEADFARGFTLARELGHNADGTLLPFGALVAIHFTHRLMALVVLAALAALAWRLHRSGDAALRRRGLVLAALAALQLGSGLGNVAFGWPLLAALLHTGGAALIAASLVSLWAAATVGAGRPAPQGAAREPAGRGAGWPRHDTRVLR